MVDRRCAIVSTVLPRISRSNASCTRYSLSASRALQTNDAVIHNSVRYKEKFVHYPREVKQLWLMDQTIIV